jgi:Calcineurin-like phosphoesterase superfamily domain
MRVALVSDVHGNAVALETVIADTDREQPDAALCLGGLIQGGPDPGRCIDLLGGLGWPVVMGNADAFVLDESAAGSSAEAVTDRQLAQRRAGSTRAASGAHHEQPEDDFRFDPWAAYGLVAAEEGGRLFVEIRRVPVDVDAIDARLEACGMPHASESSWQWRPREQGCQG